MPTEKKKIYQQFPWEKYIEKSFIVYAELECLLQPISTCDNTNNNSFTIKKSVHKPCDYSLLTSYAYDDSLNEHIYYRGKDCLSNFSKSLKHEINKIINIE